MSNLQSLKYSRGSLEVIDQLKLPSETVYVPIRDTEHAWFAIKSMQVRGAPLIAIVAALGLAVEIENKRSKFVTVEDAAFFLLEKMFYLRTSRPTAVNLFTATEELSALVGKLRSAEGTTVDSIINAYIEAAENMLAADIAANRAMGQHGAEKVLQVTKKDKVRVLTICNTGSLATAGFGTALGVVRTLHEMGKLEHVYACETRPYNQGARLTAYEIMQDKLPGTLIADSMASALMAVKGVDCVIVGADRVAANGDTANKIGTYQLAIVAQFHKVPFFVAAPTTTLDISMPNGGEITIEERPLAELTRIFNQPLAPEGMNAWNPAFDVTPCRLIRGVITELGVIECPTNKLDNTDFGDGVIPIADFLKVHCKELVVASSKQAHNSASVADKIAEQSETHAEPTGYTELHDYRVTEYILAHPNLVQLLKVDITAKVPSAQLKVKEVGDGNLNYVYIVEGNDGAIVVLKQALPYVRCVGESWPLTLRRAYFEYTALEAQSALTGGRFVPKVFHKDEKEALFVMEYIPPPHLILRKALVQGLRLPTFAADVAEFTARTLFGSSALVKDGGQLRSAVAHWSHNIAMCALTEKVVFTDPYTVCDINRWTSPQLDSYAEGIREDVTLKLAAAHFKGLFMTSTQALIHGDLHTGSVMVAEGGGTYVIDPEFAFYGPMGFDIGAMLANLFLAYFSQAGQEAAPACGGTRDDFAVWILAQIEVFYSNFVRVFTELWDEACASSEFSGEIFNGKKFPGITMKVAQASYLSTLLRDSLGFAGMKMIRRIVGIAHVEDLESIQDADRRALCEKRALRFARRLVVTAFESSSGGAGAAGGLVDINAVLHEWAPEAYTSTPSDTWVQ